MKHAPDKKDWFLEFSTGSSLAFRYYFDLYHQSLFYLSFRIVRDQEGAEDIVADTFQKLWENRERIRSENHIEGFLRMVTRNRSLNYRRHEDLRQASENELKYLNTDLDTTDLAAELIEAELIKNIHKAVERLPRKCKAVFKLIYFEHYSTRETAEKLGITERNVLNQKQRALHLLRGYLGMDTLTLLIILMAYHLNN